MLKLSTKYPVLPTCTEFPCEMAAQSDSEFRPVVTETPRNVVGQCIIL